MQTPLSFGITKADLDKAASDLNCKYLGETSGSQPTSGFIYGIQNRLLIIRNVKILSKTLSVTFILDTVAPVTYISYHTARAFGVDPMTHGVNRVRATFEGDVTLEVYFFDPTGPHNDLNVLGMDYMKAMNCEVKINGRARTITLITHSSGVM